MAGKPKAKTKGKSSTAAAAAYATPSGPSTSKQKSPLDPRYNFTPAPPQLQTKKRKKHPDQHLSQPDASPPPVDVRDYPPPPLLFQTTLTRQPQGSQGSQPQSENHRRQSSQSQPLMAPLHGSQRQPETPRSHGYSNRDTATSPGGSLRSHSLQNSSGHNNQFSGNSNHTVENEEDSDSDDSDEEVIDDTAQIELDLEESRVEALNALLSVPNREKVRGITTLSPLEPQPENTTW